MPIIRIKGLDSLQNKLKQAHAKIWPTVMRVVEKYVDLMIQDAKQNAPEDLGETKNSIGKEVGQQSITLFVGAAHGAIQEFGVGARMSVPEELEEEARKFKGYKGGNFKEFVEEIRGWCVRKGIDPDAAYPIAASILERGLKPQPFFYPAYRKYKEPMLKEIEEELQKLFDF